MSSKSKKSLYDEQVYQNCLARLDKITQDTKADWGKMSAAQMFAHCAEVIDVMNGKALKVDLITRLFKPIVRRTVFGDKPYSRGGPTAAQFEIKTAKDFAAEKARLLRSLATFHTMKPQQATEIKHPLFGTLSLEARGWSMYKHLDHHLVQFGQVESVAAQRTRPEFA